MYIITSINAKGGCGKSTIAMNLASGLAMLGYDTLLIDMDPQAQVTQWLGAGDGLRVGGTLASAFAGAESFEAVIQPTGHPKLSFVAASEGLEDMGRQITDNEGYVVLDHTVNAVDWADFGHDLPRSAMEVEAEAVALICCSALGLPGEEFSRGYIQQWISGNTIPPESVHRIFRAADRILRSGRPPDQSGESETPTA